MSRRPRGDAFDFWVGLAIALALTAISILAGFAALAIWYVE